MSASTLSQQASKGLKLDFKSADALLPCIQSLVVYEKKKSTSIGLTSIDLDRPIILNADVFFGRDSLPITIAPERFVIESLANYPRGLLSLGWTSKASPTSVYTWSNMWEAYELMRSLKLIEPPAPAHVRHRQSARITFAVRATWAVNSLHRLEWLLASTRHTLTVWSHANDIAPTVQSLDDLLLLRAYLPRVAVFYDLAEGEQAAYLRAHARQTRAQLLSMLAESSNARVRHVVATSATLRFAASAWRSASANADDAVLVGHHAAMMLHSSARLVSTREYRTQSAPGGRAYRFAGKLELVNRNIQSKQQQREQNDRDAKKTTTTTTTTGGACVCLAIRTPAEITAETADGNVRIGHGPGSVTMYLFSGGLVHIYVGERLEHQANFPPAHVFAFSIVDAGESQPVRVDLTTYGDEQDGDGAAPKARSLQFLVKAPFATKESNTRQHFYMSQTLLSNDYVCGIDKLYVIEALTADGNIS